jgi:hypothetical protein
MPSGERYAIQRVDLLWYAGNSGDSGAQWAPSARTAMKLQDLDEAKALQAKLQKEGHRVYVMAV